MSILSIVQIVVLVLDIIFFVVLGLNLLIGFIKGWKKSTLNLLAFLIPFLLIICLRGVFSNIILGINIPGVGSLREMIVNEVAGSIYSEGVPAPELVSLCESVASSIINLAVYIVGLIVALLLSFIVRLIFALTLKRFIYASTDGVKAAPSISSRLFGLIPGFAHFLTIMVLLFFPVAGVVNVCNMAVEDVSIAQSFIQASDEQRVSGIDDMLDEISAGLDESITSKIINLGKNKDTGVSLAGSYLGSLVSIKTDYAKVNIVNEYGRLRQILPVASKIMDENIYGETISFSNIAENDIKKITNAIEQTELIKLIAPTAREYLVYEISKDETNQEVVAKIEALDLIKEINAITDVLVEVIDTCSDIEIQLDKPQDILLNETLATHIDAIMDKTFKSDIINYIAMPYAIETMTNALTEEYSGLLDILTEENIKTCLQSDVSSLLTVYQDLAKYNNLHNFLFYEEDIDIESEDALNNIESSVVNLFGLSLISGNEETLIRFALDMANVEGLTYDTLFDGVNPNWSEEVKVLASTLKATAEVASLLEIMDNMNNLGLELFIQKDENGQYIIEKLLNQISNSELFKNVVLNYIDTIELDEETKKILDIVDLEKIRELTPDDFNAEFKRLLEVFDILVRMNLFNEKEIKLDKYDIKVLINNAFDSVFIKGRENDLIKFALEQAAVEGLTYENLMGEFTPNWSLEKEVLANTLSDLVGLVKEQNLTEGFSIETLVKKNESGEYIFKSIISDISKSELLKNVIVNYINTMELDEEAKEIVDLLNIRVIKDLTSNEFEKEFTGFLDILDVVISMNILNDEEIIIDKDNITLLINKLFDSVFIKGNEQQIIEYILDTTGFNTTLEETGITLNYQDVNWESEKQNLLDIFTSVLDLGSIESFDVSTLLENRTEETTDKIINLIDALGKSQIFGDAIFDMIETMVKEVGYTVTFTDSEKAKILENTWKKEASNLIELIDFCTDKLGNTDSYNSISGSEITDIMSKASTTIIATKVLGTVLNEMLGKDYLAINPILEDGSYKYDFTNPQTLLSTAKDIGALVDLKNHAQNLDMTDISKATESVDNIIESIKILDESGLAKDMIQEVIGEESGINLDEINLSEEAETIQKVYDVYKEDHENFDIENHPELKEELEESEFAKTILDMLGITL